MAQPATAVIDLDHLARYTGGDKAINAEVMRLFDEASEKRREFQREATTQTLNLLAILSPAQRAKFVAMVRERRPLWLRQHSAAQH